MMKIWSALFYAVSSTLITVLNKIILTNYGFPSFQLLAAGQILVTILILHMAKSLQLVNYPRFRRDAFKKVFPLPLITFANAVTGLGGTKELSLPMFTVLRRFSILMTMIGELCFLSVRPTMAVQVAVFTMIVGAVLAAVNDLAFSLQGYSLISLNNFFTSANGICIKQKLESKEFGQYGLMYYNALFMTVPAILLVGLSGEMNLALQFEGWTDPYFIGHFLLSCIMGCVLNASVVMCTHHNSALTTSIIGCLKNVSVTYLGMLFGDYVFDCFNFVGINISVFGSLIYTYVAFKQNTSNDRLKPNGFSKLEKPWLDAR